MSQLPVVPPQHEPLGIAAALALREGRLTSAALAERLPGQDHAALRSALLADGWLQPADGDTHRMAPRRAHLFGADIGGTKIHAAIAGLDGEILVEIEQPTTQDGGAALVEQLHDICTALASEAGVPPTAIAAGALGIPGSFNPKTRRPFLVPNITGFEGFPIVEAFEQRMGFPVRIDNDANMAAQGEMWRGEGRNVGCFVFIAIGTGIGMGIINDGRVLAGSRGAAGEIATLPIGGDPFDTRNFHAGAFETSIGSLALADRYAALGGTPGLSVRQIVDALADGDVAAEATIAEMTRQLAIAIAAITAVLDPERIVLGGSIGARAEVLERLRACLPLCMFDPPDCVVSTLGRRAGLIGTISRSHELLADMLAGGDPTRIGRSLHRT